MGRPPKSPLPAELHGLLQRVAANLRAIREEQGLSQAELARRSSISTTTLNEIETRQFRDIRISTLSALARALNVDLVEVVRPPAFEIDDRDHRQLLKASEAIAKITRKLR